MYLAFCSGFPGHHNDRQNLFQISSSLDKHEDPSDYRLKTHTKTNYSKKWTGSGPGTLFWCYFPESWLIIIIGTAIVKIEIHRSRFTTTSFHKLRCRGPYGISHPDIGSAVNEGIPGNDLRGHSEVVLRGVYELQFHTNPIPVLEGFEDSHGRF